MSLYNRLRGMKGWRVILKNNEYYVEEDMGFFFPDWFSYTSRFRTPESALDFINHVTTKPVKTVVKEV